MDKTIKNREFYVELEDNKIQCTLCPHYCIIGENKNGICSVRKNTDGRLITSNYGKITACHMDPIEKKPLYHFYPGGNILSIGSYGCNLKCSFCQNYEIVHKEPDYMEVLPQDMLEIVLKYNNNIGLAFTYNEPSIWYEYIEDIAKEIKKINKKVVLITNGYINKEPLKRLLPLIDAMNIDLKAFSEDFYKDICKGNVNHVMETIEISSQQCHVEITTLLIEGHNSSEDEIKELSRWIASIDKDIPLHLSRYYPAYKMTLPATSIEIMYNLKDIASKYLNYVYIGNVQGADRNTYCPKCKALIVERIKDIKIVNIEDSKCSKCNKKINLIT